MGVLPGAEHSLSEVFADVSMCISRLGVMHRLFGRPKSLESIAKKVELKRYIENGRKVQDALGIRIVVYFPRDCELVREAVEARYQVVDRSIDEPLTREFCPRRLNLVAEVPGHMWNIDAGQLPIDRTFEIQVRTVFSEGWHEIEHDLRYKCQADWITDLEPSPDRTLNGTLGALETAEWAMVSLFDTMAHFHYRRHNWEAMLRHHFRVRLQDGCSLGGGIREVFDSKEDAAKAVFRASRKRLLLETFKSGKLIPWTLDNVVFLAEAVERLRIEEIRALRPKYIAEVIDEAFPLK